MSLTAPTNDRPRGLFQTKLAVQALRPRRRMKPSEWATANVTLPRGQTSIPGRLDHRNAPYLPGIIDACVIPGVNEVVVMKAGQIGVSECFRWFIGYCADMDPDPVGLILPDETKGKGIMADRYKPMFRRSEALRDLMTSRARDVADLVIRLSNGFMLKLMWSGSASSTSSDPYRRVLCDEIDKFSKRAGRESSAIEHARTRVRTFGESSLVMYVSTPTTKQGEVYRLWKDTDHKLYFQIPCPHCGVYQWLMPEQLKWPDFGTDDRVERARRVRTEDAAWLECVACKGEIREADKRRVMPRARWGTCNEDGTAGGAIEDLSLVTRLPRGTRLGFQVGALHLMWERISKTAEEWIFALGDFLKMFKLRTETFGLPFEDLLTKIKPEFFRELCDEATLAEGVCPWWTAQLIAAVDTQADHFWVVIRAFGPAWRSHLVYQGRVESFADLDRLTKTMAWKNEREGIRARQVDLTVIDSGGTRAQSNDENAEELPSRTMEVYDWVMRSPRARAIKGSSRPQPGELYKRGKGVYLTKRVKKTLPIWLLDTHKLQDSLAYHMHRTIECGVDTETGETITERAWTLNRRFDETYAKHMANMEKVTDSDGNEIGEAWVPVGPGARVDLRDCEGYAIVGAYMQGVHLLPELAEWEVQQEAVRKEQERMRAQPRRQGMRTPDGRPWLATNRK